MEKVQTGSRILDRMLEGGYDSDTITTVYGPAGSGKTVLCLLCALNITRQGKKVIYVDTEGSFSVERLKQIALDYQKILYNIVFLRPTTFKKQAESIEKLNELVNDKIGLIVVDTISMLYRLERKFGDEGHDFNRELGLQIAGLS